jgi:large subunit ribosomal protein L10
VARSDKVAAVAGLSERLRSSNGVVLAEYRGLTVAQLAELRRLLGANAVFSVVKNTLTRLAARDAGLEEEISSLLSGPSAIAFVSGDVVEAARGLRDFARANPLLVLKGGVVDGGRLGPGEIIRLADVEPREVLLAMLAGAVTASVAHAAATLGGVPAQLVRLVEALRVKREQARGGG